VKQQLEGRTDFVINAGRYLGGKESTTVDVTRQSPVILHQGIIPSQDIEKAYEEYLEAR